MTKPTKWPVRPAKIQISLGIRPVWSESSLSAWWKFGPLATYWAHSEDSDQTGRTCQFVSFVTSRLKWDNEKIFSERHNKKLQPPSDTKRKSRKRDTANADKQVDGEQRDQPLLSLWLQC